MMNPALQQTVAGKDHGKPRVAGKWIAAYDTAHLHDFAIYSDTFLDLLQYHCVASMIVISNHDQLDRKLHTLNSEKNVDQNLLAKWSRQETSNSKILSNAPAVRAWLVARLLVQIPMRSNEKRLQIQFGSDFVKLCA